MTNLQSYLMIAASIAAMVILLHLLDRVFAEENQRRKDEERDALREDKRRENAVWEIVTRVGDDRSDLFRSYSEMEVR